MYSGFVYQLSELINCREATSRHQGTTSRSQKRTPSSDRKPSQADTSLPSSKQHPRGQKSMCLHCPYYHVVALTCSRHHSARKPSTNRPRPLGNGNKGKKNKKLNIPLLGSETSLLRSEFELSLRVVLKRNYIRRRRVTPVRTVPTLSNIGFRPGGGVRSTSNKTVKSGKISNGASLRKSSNKGIGYRSITPESHSDQCTVFTPYSICLQGRSLQLPYAVRIRNQPFRRPAINYRGKSKALSTGIRTIQLNWRGRVATCASLL